MSYHCPYCHKESFAPEGLEALTSLPLICAHCHESFEAENDEPADKGRGTKKAEPLCPICCPDCDAMMHITAQEYQALWGHVIHCPSCQTALTLPTPLPEPVRLPRFFTADLIGKLSLIYLVILGTLALLFTSEGSQIIEQLAASSDISRTYLYEFRAIWHDFLSYIQGQFI